MKLLFNDGQTLKVQSVMVQGNILRINVINNLYEQLVHLFTNPITTKKISVEDDNGIILQMYENYTIFESIITKSGGIFIVQMEQEGKDTNTRLAELEKKDEVREAAIKDMKENGAGEAYGSVLTLARMQAQNLEDTDAIAVKNLYPIWEDIIGQTVKIGYKFLYIDVLYKTIQDDLLIREEYTPGQGTESLYAKIDEIHTGTKEDPIPYSGNMELVEGKYYIQDEVVYKCTRSTGQPVYNALIDLVDLYVELA